MEAEVKEVGENGEKGKVFVLKESMSTDTCWVEGSVDFYTLPSIQSYLSPLKTGAFNYSHYYSHIFFLDQSLK